LALGFVRICSDPQVLEHRLNELKDMLMSRQYNTNIINSAIQRALTITRHDALKKVEKSKNKRVILPLLTIFNFLVFLPSLTNTGKQ